jgi:hypothetical protein
MSDLRFSLDRYDHPNQAQGSRESSGVLMGSQLQGGTRSIQQARLSFKRIASFSC